MSAQCHLLKLGSLVEGEAGAFAPDLAWIGARLGALGQDIAGGELNDPLPAGVPGGGSSSCAEIGEEGFQQGKDLGEAQAARRYLDSFRGQTDNRLDQIVSG